MIIPTSKKMNIAFHSTQNKYAMGVVAIATHCIGG